MSGIGDRADVKFQVRQVRYRTHQRHRACLTEQTHNFSLSIMGLSGSATYRRRRYNREGEPERREPMSPQRRWGSIFVEAAKTVRPYAGAPLTQVNVAPAHYDLIVGSI